ncbi:cobalamin trafficking protein CblD-like [Gigantopelta aegis]|uniref:cobalamin trafficking protein CblD-like n=1 Tax=Gigantopelta aegis TaxID=1735272 RepID=UPI001B88AA48|nr:cobalamin trafficking protein CblD-like [Gigantopelta aegis]
MAARLISGNRKIVAYLPNLQAVVKHLRTFSSYDGHQHSGTYFGEPTGSATVWPDKDLGPFGPEDKRFPLPGRVGHSLFLRERPIIFHPDPSSTLPQLPVERHSDIAEQFLSSVEQIEESSGFLPESIPQPSEMLECIAQDCPMILRKEFADLFPERNILEGVLTVISISQKTVNDMTVWSADVEIERETLLEAFIQGATEICEALQEGGYWADFIDPSCGKPYLGSHTNSVFFETDDRYRKLGFEIVDLGCCKVISHHIWGTHTFVGSLFTNAPLDHEVLQDMKTSR